RFLERVSGERGMLDRQKDSRQNGDACVKEEARSEAIAKQEERTQRGDDRLNVQDHIYDGGIPILQRQSKKNGADGRACESGEDEITPRARVDPGQIHEL